jgi:hypothetical protein
MINLKIPLLRGGALAQCRGRGVLFATLAKNTPPAPLKRGGLRPALSVKCIVLVGILILSGLICHAGDEPLELKPIRQKMLLAMKSAKVTDSLYNSLNKLSNKPPVITAYLGTLDALKAKHTWNPYNKIKDLNLSRDVLQKAVTAEPHNMEIRFLRFSIQHNVPSFLGYGKNLNEDRAEIMTQLALKKDFSQDKELTRTIVLFLQNSKRCTAAEVEKLHNYLAEIK